MADAVTMLKDEHRKMRELFEELLGTTDRAVKGRRALLAEIGKEVKIHAKIEEEIFYPEFAAFVEDRKDDKLLFYRATEDHHAVDVITAEFNIVPVDSPQFIAKVELLFELIEKHMKMEEREMFPIMKQMLDRDQMQALYEQMRMRHESLEAQWNRAVLRPVKKVQGVVEAFMPSWVKTAKGESMAAVRGGGRS